MLEYAFKNIRSLFTRQQLLAFLLVLNIVASAFVLCFSYGVYRNYDKIKERGETKSDILALGVYMDSDEWISYYDGQISGAPPDITPQSLADFARSLSDELSENIDYILFDYWVETPMSYCDDSMHLEDGVYVSEKTPDDEVFYSDDAEPFWYKLDCRFKIVDGMIVDYNDDQFISYEQYDSGEKVISVAKTVFNIPGKVYDETLGLSSNVGPYNTVSRMITRDVISVRRQVPHGTDTLIFGGERYKIVSSYGLFDIGHRGTVSSYVNDTAIDVDRYEWVKIPVTAMPDSILIDAPGDPWGDGSDTSRSIFCINFKDYVTDLQCEEINEKLAETMGENVYLEPQPIVMSRETDYFNTVIVLALFIGILASINMAILYRYILEKRSAELAIFRICGCTQEKAIASYLAECLMIEMPLFAVTQLAYHIFVMPRMTEIFPYMDGVYTPVFYIAVFCIYVAVSAFIMYKMIKSAVNKHSLVTLKNAKRSTNRFGIMKALEIAQLAAIISILVMVVSAITSRYEMFKPFEEYLSHKGYLMIANGSAISTDQLEEMIDGADHIVNLENGVSFGDPLSEDYVAFRGIQYSDEFIDLYTPPVMSGVWLSDTDETYENSGCIPAVLTNGTGNYHVGDVLSNDVIMGYDDQGNVTEALTVKYKIVGILNDNVNIISYIPSDWKTDSYEIKNYLAMFNVYSAENEHEQWLLTRISDELACYGFDYAPIYGAQLVFCDDMTDEEYADIGEQLSVQGNFSVEELSTIYDNSKTHIYEQMYSLFPVAVCIFILTLISAVSINAIYTKRQLRNYAIFYICGAKWSRCALMSLRNGVMTCITSSILAALVLTLGKTFLFSDTVISFGMWHLAVCAAVVLLYLILSMIMPLSIIGSAQPREVLKEE